MNAARRLVPAWLLTGLPGAPRAAAIAHCLAQVPAAARVSLLLEGASADEPKPGATGALRVHVLAPGCPWCIGNLTLRVTLARVLQQEDPQVLIMAIADASHRPRLARLLCQPPWAGWLELQAVTRD